MLLPLDLLVFCMLSLLSLLPVLFIETKLRLGWLSEGALVAQVHPLFKAFLEFSLVVIWRNFPEWRSVVIRNILMSSVFI